MQSHAFMELWQARCVQGYVAVHLHSKINLGDLAKVTQFSRWKFNRTFKASFGCTPGQYVRRMRITRDLASAALREFAKDVGRCARVTRCSAASRIF
jgi:AraC-like DNA-binding protein